MQEQVFLFVLALVWVTFASIHDLKKREVPNWLSYSLVIFGLSYRAFYALSVKQLSFFLYGLIGFAIFFALAYALYYGRVFAGGDAKLLMGMGVILPLGNTQEVLFNALFFLILLFLLGAAYSLIYSVGIVFTNMRQFKKALIKKIKGQHKPFIVFGGIYTVLLSLIYIFKVSPTTPAALLLLWTAFYGIPLIVIYMLLYLYLKALEQSCLIKLVSPSQLTEGDWLEKDILVKGHLIKKSVHGLSSKEIEILRKAKKSVWIRYGVPFVPAFLLALLTMGYVFFVAQLDAQQILSWLL